jgi:hypothetical protein
LDGEGNEMLVKTWIQRRGVRSAAYLVCALLFGIGAVAGFEYGALIPYLVPVALCLLQFAYPTPVGWASISALVAIATGLMLFALVRDVAGILGGRQPSVFLDLGDSVVFAGLNVLLIFLTLWLYRVRPRKLAV